MKRLGWVFRGGLGGVLMGLANLVPGISGGTMLVAAGIYRRFIDAIADVTRLRFRRESIGTLAVVVGAAILAILLLAGTVRDLVVEYRWVMYSIFIGLTLGGVPLVWRMAAPLTRASRIGIAAGFVCMALLAWLQSDGGTASQGGAGWPLFLLAGAAGAAAMILPGVSGGYLLLVLGAYVPVLTGVDELKEGLRAKDWAAVWEVGIDVVLPVGIGVAVGVAVVSNLLKIALHRYEKATLGVLIGLLFGAIVGLWPFQHGVEPKPGDVVKGRVMTEQTIAELEPKDWPTEFFRPELMQILGALGLIVAGFAVTALIAKLSGSEE
ncbi:MAG: undecaprenyl phosphate translocase family protein [Planctomycetota bacterium]|jgi:putative membrane protein